MSALLYPVLMQQVVFPEKVLQDLFREAKEKLSNVQHVSHVQYTNFNHLSFAEHNGSLLDAVSKKSIVYCLWAGPSKEKLTPKYIGHADKNISPNRMRNHLMTKNPKTGAQLENVKTALSKKQCIGVSFIEIKPAYMRMALEEWLIGEMEELLWNKQKKNKKQKGPILK